MMQEITSGSEKIQQVVNTIAQAVAPKRILLFGSHARGTAQPESDIDLMVIANMSMPQRERRLFIRSLFARPDFSMDLFVFTEEEFERQRKIPNTIARTVDREGIVVYE